MTPVGEGPDVSVIVVRLGNVVGTEGTTIGVLLAWELLGTVEFPDAVPVGSRVLQDRLHVKTLDFVALRPALTDVGAVGAVVSVTLPAADDVTPDGVKVVMLTNVEGATVGSNGLLVVLRSEVGRPGAVVRLVWSTGRDVIVVVKVRVMMTGGGDAVPVIETKTELSSLVGVAVVFLGVVLFALVGRGPEGNVTVVLVTLENTIEEGAGAPVPGTAGVVEFAKPDDRPAPLVGSSLSMVEYVGAGVVDTPVCDSEAESDVEFPGGARLGTVEPGSGSEVVDSIPDCVTVVFGAGTADVYEVGIVDGGA
ncbi:uncharacterized protein B0T15DRAFT_504288 [Chaetomium strumarium]|uniref:Uncharacterized protein n=1 Tax=Chaetomium strumarium TaxID=1170767 RepID=A0AAJ0GN15_9PEZI|nr:hypothetical protein B0T15DRAFT_504288 [Chaetomium strumarium]